MALPRLPADRDTILTDSCLELSKMCHAGIGLRSIHRSENSDLARAIQGANGYTLCQDVFQFEAGEALKSDLNNGAFAVAPNHTAFQHCLSQIKRAVVTVQC